MIKVTDRFYITADTNCYKVIEKATVQDEESKNFGKEVTKDIGYFTTIEQCLSGILKVMSREYVSKETQNTIADLKEELHKQNKLIKESVGNLECLC